MKHVERVGRPAFLVAAVVVLAAAGIGLRAANQPASPARPPEARQSRVSAGSAVSAAPVSFGGAAPPQGSFAPDAGPPVRPVAPPPLGATARQVREGDGVDDDGLDREDAEDRSDDADRADDDD